jgi:catechol 2,3-dioxygenase-like lactoylglutathione lyase family enzyme
MLQLEHINLVVKDVPAMLKFYQTAFPHWRVRSEGDSEWYGKPRHWLHFGDDFQYLALSDHGEGENRDLTGHSMGLAHFAFVTSNLDAISERLQQAGYEVAIPLREDSYRRNIYFIDPAGFEVEFVEYRSDVPAERNKDD